MQTPTMPPTKTESRHLAGFEAMIRTLGENQARLENLLAETSTRKTTKRSTPIDYPMPYDHIMFDVCA